MTGEENEADEDSQAVDGELVADTDIDVDAGTEDPIDLSASEYYLNRELSELAFQDRVLHEAADDRNAPLEQLRSILETMLADNRRRWLMGPDGTYEQVRPSDGDPVRGTQSILMQGTRRAGGVEGDDRGTIVRDLASDSRE